MTEVAVADLDTSYVTQSDGVILAAPVIENETVRVFPCPNTTYGCTFSGADENILSDHLENACQKQQLLLFIEEREENLNQLKAELRFRDEELINLKLVLFGNVEKDRPQHQIDEENAIAAKLTANSTKSSPPTVLFFKNIKDKIEAHKSKKAAQKEEEARNAAEIIAAPIDSRQPLKNRTSLLDMMKLKSSPQRKDSNSDTVSIRSSQEDNFVT
ncbi:hypothetical protein SARC_12200 [Sphaeroforma arctica JP610]|uniref:Uncharacterized protein n=1 Tax=Sphaeroforma arctica JP610 TaxID=667725 RepID=A0A0L0FEU4_9EUKA|nr:hypothetical protein SARC_12200 [Sphaeroforma arctica JP610]KNC75270.1 hypothetical protein SARC_12200 [Sphaeroforma arctica JP610]|eukprot:XP_014149172.1 hypothetical protein SARC_12200 [Sphaeroforma arctica JP610]